MPKVLKDQSEFKDFVNGDRLALVHFSASWAPQCQQLNDILDDFKIDVSGDYEVASIDAEGVPEVTLAAKVTAAPTTIFYKKGKEVARVNGVQPPELRNLIIKHSGTSEASVSAPTKEDLNDRLKRLITTKRLMLFMKGNAQAPRCGFSRQTVDLLNGINADFGTFDILSDEEVRQGLKEYSNWPTYPQLYLDGELVGGLDVIREELNDADFVDKLPKKV